MKKLSLFLLLLTTGCITKPYTCFEHLSKVICISNVDMEALEHKDYTVDDVVQYITTNTRNSICTTDFDKTLGESYVFSDGQKVPFSTNPLVCLTGTISQYERHVAELQQEQEKKNQEEARKKQLAETMKKNGCPDFFELWFPYKVLQQTESGTLIRVWDGYASYAYMGGREIYFVTKNKIDSNKVDDEAVPKGYFQQIGTYKYTTPMGATKTVRKLKRCQ